jgi:hypothetical protein
VKKIKKLPNIEIGSHSFSHPFFLDNLNRTGEYGHNIPVPGYKVDFYTEIFGSLKTIKNMFPKKAKNMYFWTGNCKPTEKILDITDKAGILTING